MNKERINYLAEFVFGKKPEDSIEPFLDRAVFTVDAVKKYCLLKYENEIKFNKQKELLDAKMNEVILELMENGIGIRNLSNVRVMYEKQQSMLDSDDIVIDELFELLINIYSENKSNNSHSYLLIFKENRNLVERFYKIFFENRSELNKLKRILNDELLKFGDYLANEGVPKILFRDAYKKFKIDIGLVEMHKGCRNNLEFYDNLYLEMREDLITQAIIIKKDFGA